MQDLAMLVAGSGSTPRIALDIAARRAMPIAGVVQLGADVPFTCDLPSLGGEARLSDASFLDAYGIVNGVQGASRAAFGQRVLDAGGTLTTLIHPNATIAASASLGAGCLISAGAVINVDARIGRHCLIHSGATIDHDDVLEDAVTISPGAHLAGHVTICEGAFIGIGAIIIGGVTVGIGATVGAGAVVLRDVHAGATVVGNPARTLAAKSR
jgi:sugar O-acyltransferase (sialic acid O-acetyltransferase NeuD family)